MKKSKLNKLFNKGRLQAIVREVAGRRMLFGYARITARSRKQHIKYLSSPVDLSTLSQQAQKNIAEAAAPTASPTPPAPTQPTPDP